MGSYPDFVALYANLDRIRVANVHDHAEGVRLGTGQAPMPGDWIDLLTDDPEERAKWRAQEFRREPG